MTFISYLGLYCLLWVLAVILLGLTAAQIHYTKNLPPDDLLKGGHKFYDPVIAELLATSILVTLWSTFAIHTIIRRSSGLIIYTCVVESIALSMLFTMWLVGSAITTTTWRNLSPCQVWPCHLFSALVAIAWTGWVILLILFGLNLIYVSDGRTWTVPIHGQ